jgi:hypothetical protein
MGWEGRSQITLLQDYVNNNSAVIGTFQNISFREGGFSSLYPIANTNGKEFWTISDRGVNVDCASANPAGCTPTYDKLYGFKDYAPKIHRIRLNGDSVQILQTITMKRPGGTNATGLLNPAGYGSSPLEEASTDTVLNCANFSSKIAPKDIWGIDSEGLVVDQDGNFWISEEGGPAIWKLNPNGVVIKRFTPFANLPGAQPEDIQIDTIFKYRKNNRGFEGLSITPGGKIYAIIQSPLLNPSTAVGEGTRIHRILEINPFDNSCRMFVYLNDGIIGLGANQIRLKDWKIGEMVAVNDNEFLVIEAAARGTSDIKKIYRINIAAATPVTSALYSGVSLEALVDNSGLLANSITPVTKTLVMDLLANGWPAALDKAEGLAIVNDSTIAVCNDNDYGQSSPTANGIATPTGKACHILKYSLKGVNKLTGYVAPLINFIAGETGPSTSQSPYLNSVKPNVKFTSIISAGETIGGYKMCGVPDGLGAFDNGDGTFTLVMNHEFGTATTGIVRAHGSKGAFVSKWVIKKSDLSVVSGADLIQNVKIWNTGTSSYDTYNAANPNTLAGFARFCSADLPAVSAFYNSATGLGTQERIFMNGEEPGNEGRGFAHIVTGPNGGTTYQLPYLGRFSWENSVANPATGDKTLVGGMDDSTPGQVYFYLGTKTNTGTEIEKAGLSNGLLYGVTVNGLLTEANTNTPAAGTAFTLTATGAVDNITGAVLNTNSNNAGITTFLRPEDGAWDPSNPNDFYFNTTNAFGSTAGVHNNSRLWKLHFNDLSNPVAGGTITAVLDGTEGQEMLDNLTIDNYGHILLVEDVGGNAHIGKVWQYTIATDQLVQIAEHDRTRFLTGGANFLTQDEEASGILDVQSILGAGMFLTVVQAHYAVAGEVVEGGQLLAFYNPDSYNANPEISVLGNSIEILKGDNTPSITDNTDFENVTTGNEATKTFSIRNSGPGSLSINGISFTGTNASEFTLVSAPTFPLTIAANSYQTIIVQFAPAADGSRTATLTISSNDFDEAGFDFALKATAVSPEINVQGNGATITDGDVTPSATDNTNFGIMNTGLVTSKTFDIQNLGTGTLSVTGINFTGTNASEYTLVSAPTFPVTIAASGSQTITVQFAPLTYGNRNATINIANDDTDEGTYNFDLLGYSTIPSAIETMIEGSSIKLYPNPSGDVATLSISLDNPKNLSVGMFNMQGDEVITTQERYYEKGKQKIMLNTSGLNNGIYYVQISSGEQSVKIKTVVVH